MKKIGFFIMNIESARGTGAFPLMLLMLLLNSDMMFLLLALAVISLFSKSMKEINIYAMNKLPYSLKKTIFLSQKNKENWLKNCSRIP